MTIAILKAVLFLMCAIQAVFETLYYVHMLQLNSYRPERYVRWMKEHDDRVLPFKRFVSLIPLAAWMCLGNRISGTAYEELALAAAIFMVAIGAVLDRPEKAKKPLVYTDRVKRLLATIFVLLAAMLVAAWFFNPLLMGAMLLFTVLLPVLVVLIANFINAPMEKAIGNWYINDARRILEDSKDLTIIGVTGSYGKTTTKNYLKALLSVKYSTLMTPGSFNTTMGVVRTVREHLRGYHEVFVCEMGAKNKGDIKEICDLVHPKYGMITAIGEQHLETFKTVDTIIDTKFELVDALPADGQAFLNFDNEYIAGRRVENVPTCTYGLGDGRQYTAKIVRVDSNGTTFTATTPDGETCEYTTHLLGAHTIQNLIGCIAVAHQLGVGLVDMKLPIRQMKPVEHRLQLLPNGYIDDAYNSNPAGFRSALDVLGAMENTRRVLVTPGMVELGDRQDALNEELGAYAANCCDVAVLVGEKQAPPLKKGLLSAGFPEDKIFVATDLKQGLAYVQSLPKADKQIVLLENDLPDNF